MSAVDNIVTDAPAVSLADALASFVAPADAPADAPEIDLSDHITNVSRDIDGYRVLLTNNGRAVAADVARHKVTGKATEWDALLAGMLKQSRGAEAIVPPTVKLGNDGAPRAVYATSRIQAARLRLAAHEITRVTVERLDGSVDGKTGSVTFGALLVTVTPRNRR